MADLTKNAISETVRDRGKLTKFWITRVTRVKQPKFSKTQNFMKNLKMANFTKNAISEMVRDRVKQTKLFIV